MRINKVIGFQQFLSSAITSAVACSSALMKLTQTGDVANAAEISVGGSTGAIRFRDDGTAPTSNIGTRLPAGTVPYLYQGDLHKLQMIADAVPGNADVNVRYVLVAD